MHAGLAYTAQEANPSRPGVRESFPNRATAVKCSVGSQTANRSLVCLDLDQVGPDIYDKGTRDAVVNFYLTTEPVRVKKEH